MAQGERATLRRWIIAGILALLTGCIVTVIPGLRAHSERQQTVSAIQSLSRDRVNSAAQAYARERNITNGTVLLNDLVSTGYLRPGEVGSLGNRGALVFITTNVNYPQAFWIRVPVVHGSEIVGLMDGSVQLVARQ